ncbi:MAG TPA: J domain-containing protein [Vicinamibacterales bacterium]|nr:J domain-containing protein [Vicinamibacterales bacterium]
MEFKNYYATLGIPKTATAKEVKQAYRKMARKYHPDVNPSDKSAEARFKEINEAYEVIGDPEKRKKYDELGSNWKAYEQQAQRGGGGGAGQGSYRTMTPEEMQDLFGNEDPFSDFFHAFFSGGGEPQMRGRGGRAGSRAAGPRKGRDVEHLLDLSLEDAYKGATRRFSMQHDGGERNVDVRIPPGVGEGSRVRVSGEGEQGAGGASSGDLYLRIHMTPDSRFERKGQDLHAKVRVPVTTAVLGGEAEVPNPGGKPIRLRIPAGTQNGQVFRLKGKGMPIVGKPAEFGDLYATVEAELPRELTPEERVHYEALAKLAGGKSSAA